MISSGLVRPNADSRRSRMLSVVLDVMLVIVLAVSILTFHANATAQETVVSEPGDVAEVPPAG